MVSVEKAFPFEPLPLARLAFHRPILYPNLSVGSLLRFPGPNPLDPNSACLFSFQQPSSEPLGLASLQLLGLLSEQPFYGALRTQVRSPLL
jgi:hypothetical protein